LDIVASYLIRCYATSTSQREFITLHTIYCLKRRYSRSRR